jgi:tricorn protease
MRKTFAVRAVFAIRVCALMLAASAAQAQVGYYRQPAIAGDTVVFVAEGDLWRVNASGGAALRLTTNLAEESRPAISPDGTTIAFTARYEGPAEIYVMPMAGGLPTRLTYDGDVANVQGFTPDGKVLFATLRYSDRPSTRLFTIDIKTRVTTAVPLAEAGEGCYAGRNLFFARLPINSDNVRGYKGGLVQRIWKFDGSREAQLLTGNYAGTSRQPMCGAARVYFLSDRDGLMNVWSMNTEGSDLRQHTQHKEFEIRGAAISVDSTNKTERIVYQRGADLYVLDPANGRDTKLDIALQSDFEHTRTRWVKNPWDFVTHVESSPTGDRVAITARGQIFSVPVGAGRRVEVTRTAGNASVDARARFATFSHDGKSIYAFSDSGGEMELWRYPANGVGAAKQLTRDAKILRERAYPSPDGKWIAHTDKDRRLYLLDLATGTDKEIDRGSQDIPAGITWSPDSRWIAFSKGDKNFFTTLHVIEIATSKLTQISSTRYDATSAAFSPDGKWLYFLSNRNLQSVVPGPWGQRTPEPFFDRQTRIYAYALDPAARWPFLPKDELQRPQDVAKDPPKEPPKDGMPPGDAKPSGSAAPATPPRPSALVLDGLTDRLYEVPTPSGNLSQLSTDGKRLYFLSAEASVERKLSLRSVPIESPPTTPVIPEVFFDEIRSYQLTQDRKKLFIRKANDLFVFETGKAPPPPGEHGKFAVNLRDWTFELDPREEWKQMFVDAWRMHRDFFYDANLHGVDWKKSRARYEPLLARVTDRQELNDIIAQMIAELAILHSQVGQADLRRGVDTIDVASLAADTEKTPQGFRIKKIFGGDPELLEERSPLSRPEVNVKVGETITAVNGVAASGSISLGELLRNQTARQVLLSVADTQSKSRDVIVTPIDPRRDRDLRYLTWERERAERASRASNARIGYVHLQAMGANDIARWAREFYPVFQREGLIIDLRRNGGGNIDSWIIEKLQRRAWHFWKSRSSDEYTSNQPLAFRGHIVALIDAETYSDGETMAQGLRRLGIAPLIGVTTAGAGIWLSDRNRLRDNGIARAAESGSFVDDGKERAWITEGVGVTPDIVVDNLPFATFNGADAQLDAAISYLMDKMAKEPMRKPLAPAYPVIGK